MKSPHNREQTYRIDTVYGLSGIQAGMPRLRERRYGVIAPHGSTGEGREDNEDDVNRSRFIKRLADSGDSISSIAAHDDGELNDSTLSGESATGPQQEYRVPTRIVVIGDTLAQHMVTAADRLVGIELLAFGRTAESVLSLPASPVADVMVIEISTLHAGATREIIHWLDESQARQALVVYRFAAAEALQRLPASRIQTVRAPVTPIVVRNLCTGMVSARVQTKRELQPGRCRHAYLSACNDVESRENGVRSSVGPLNTRESVPYNPRS